MTTHEPSDDHELASGSPARVTTSAEGIATITLNRPRKRNALSPDLIRALRDALRNLRSDVNVRVVVLTGAGDRAFCAGGDLASGMAATEAGLPAAVDDKGQFVRLVLDLYGLEKPVIARVNGDALGGGLGLMLACDLAVAAEDVRLGLPEIHVGLWPMMVTSLLVRHVGRKVALELMMLGKRIDAEEGRRMGLLNRVVPRHALDTEIETLAAALAVRSPAALKMGKSAFYQTADLPLEAALWAQRDRLLLSTMTEDAAEGVAAFLENRTPQWTGR